MKVKPGTISIEVSTNKECDLLDAVLFDYIIFITNGGDKHDTENLDFAHNLRKNLIKAWKNKDIDEKEYK